MISSGIRDQSFEEGRDCSGWRRGVHHDGETDFGLGRDASIPHLVTLLFPD